MIEKLRRHGMALTAYCPLARGRVFGNATLETIAKRHGKTVGQVALRWLVQQPGRDRHSALVQAGACDARTSRSSTSTLTPAEMQQIGALGAPGGRVVNVGVAPAWD